MYVRVMVFSANFQNIKTNEDTTSLQDDLNNLQDWERDWQMHINPDKCEVIWQENSKSISQIDSTCIIHFCRAESEIWQVALFLHY
jgi:hypothetical protein